MSTKHSTLQNSFKNNIKKSFLKEKPFALGAPAFIWQLLFFYIPLLFILFLSFTQLSVDSIYNGFTLEHYKNFFASTYVHIIVRSLLLAISTGIACFFIGYPLAYYIAFKSKHKNLLLFLLIVPFWTNFLLHIFAWFFLLDHSGLVNNMLVYFKIVKEPIQFLNTMFAIFLVMVYAYLPFMVLPLYSILEKFDKKLIEASQDLGASLWQTLIRIMLPLSLPGIISGFFLVFVPSFGEFAIPSLMGGDRYAFVGNVIYSYILGNRTMELGSAFTVLSVLVLALFLWISYSIFKKFYTIEL